MCVFHVYLPLLAAKKVRVGDSYGGLVHWDACRTLPDYNLTMIVTEMEGNAIKVTSVSNIGGTVREYDAVGYLNSARGQLVLLGADRGRLGVVCSLQQDSADVGAACRIFDMQGDRQCASFHLQKRRQCKLLVAAIDVYSSMLYGRSYKAYCAYCVSLCMFVTLLHIVLLDCLASNMRHLEGCNQLIHAVKLSPSIAAFRS